MWTIKIENPWKLAMKMFNDSTGQINFTIRYSMLIRQRHLPWSTDMKIPSICSIHNSLPWCRHPSRWVYTDMSPNIHITGVHHVCNVLIKKWWCINIWTYTGSGFYQVSKFHTIARLRWILLFTHHNSISDHINLPTSDFNTWLHRILHVKNNNHFINCFHTCIDFSPAYLLSNFRIWATSCKKKTTFFFLNHSQICVYA